MVDGVLLSHVDLNLYPCDPCRALRPARTELSIVKCTEFYTIFKCYLDLWQIHIMILDGSTKLTGFAQWRIIL